MTDKTDKVDSTNIDVPENNDQTLADLNSPVIENSSNFVVEEPTMLSKLPEGLDPVLSRDEVNKQRTVGFDADAANDRPARIPVSGNRDVLTVQGKEEGYHYRWVKDDRNRLQKFRAAGYEFVQHDVKVGEITVNASANSETVVTNRRGDDTLYLMRIKQEWYDEDQSAKQKVIAEQEALMKQSLNSKDDGRYGSVSITR